MAGYQGTIPYQSSYCLSNNGSCPSDSIYCQCASLITGEAVCTRQMDCASAEECDSTSSCVKEISVCVLEPRCDYKPLCYPIGIFGPQACPTDENN